MNAPRALIIRLTTLALLIGTSVLALRQLSAPPPLPVSASVSDFSAARALKHIERIARAPHPVGSSEHAAVRDYITGELSRMGVSFEIQRKTVAQDETKARLTLCDVENVIAWRPGTGGSRRTLLLVAHYDSVPTGPGASDDGHAVAVLLETLRALGVGPPLKNDLLVLFSDAEEVGSFGAQAFVLGDPRIRNVSLAMNFEARGTHGPAFLFETSSGNGWLIREFARGAPFPMASSFMYEIYRRLPNDTDLSELKRAGISGLNFAFFDGAENYHSQQDAARKVDAASVQHQGSYALSLARHFGGEDLSVTQAPDVTFFNLTGRCLIWYPQPLVWILAVLAAVVYLSLLAVGLRKRVLRLRGVGVGIATLLGLLALMPALCHLLWSLLLQVTPSVVSLPIGEPYDSGAYNIAFVMFTLAGTVVVFDRCRRFAHSVELAMGCLGVCLFLTLSLTVVAPSGSYLGVWPLLFASLSCVALFGVPEGAPLSIRRASFLSMVATPIIWLLAPWIYLLFITLTLRNVEIAVGATVLLAGFLVPQLGIISQGRAGVLSAILALAGLGSLLGGVLNDDLTPDRPAVRGMEYALDADSSRAMWITDQPPADPWTSQLIPAGTQRTGLDGFFPFTDWTFYHASAPVADLPGPSLVLLENRVDGGRRKLWMRIRTGDEAESVLLYLNSSVQVKGAEIQGQRFERLRPTETARWSVQYLSPPRDGFELVLETDPAAPVSLRVVDQYFGLPKLAVPQRPDNMIQLPYGFGSPDRTYVGRSFAQLQASIPASVVTPPVASIGEDKSSASEEKEP